METDKEKIAFLAGMHPDHDIVKSLKASVVLFWGEFAGWENKKRKKIKNLNLKMGRKFRLKNYF